jgi:hypothetical protein
MNMHRCVAARWRGVADAARHPAMSVPAIDEADVGACHGRPKKLEVNTRLTLTPHPAARARISVGGENSPAPSRHATTSAVDDVTLPLNRADFKVVD